MTIGERIRAARKKAGLTQKKLSERCGFTEVAIRQWEANKRTPRLNTIKEIAKSLEIPFETLILDDENERSNAVEESKTINFGSGPVGLQQGIDEEQLKALVGEIDKETKEAGLPWWAGMFNPKIIEAANINRSKCNCAVSDENVKEDALAAEDGFLRDVEAARKIQMEREAIMIQIDKEVLEAIHAASAMMASLMEEKNETAAMEAADLGRSIAKMRESLNPKFAPVNHWSAAV